MRQVTITLKYSIVTQKGDQKPKMGGGISTDNGWMEILLLRRFDVFNSTPNPEI